MPRPQYLLALLVTASFLMGFLALPSEVSGQDQEISFSETTDIILIETGNIEIAISKAFPAAMIIPPDQNDSLGYGVVISSVFGFNATVDGMLALEDVPYRASFEHATWSTSPVVQDADPEKGETVTVEMTASLNMNRRIASYGGDKVNDGGEPGIEIIEDWAQATVRFTVTSENYTAHYADVADSPDYHINGSAEFKFDVLLDIIKPIFATDLALDIGLMKMDNYTFVPTAMPEPYLFNGYQDDVVSESDPYENETDGDVQIVHRFSPRSEFKQLFTFVEEDEEESYFGWANLAEIGWEGLDDELIEVATFYRTDGESLRVYLATPLNETTITIAHDPSLGLFPGDGGGYIDVPDDIIPIGTSGESVIIGAMIGIGMVGAVGAYAVSRRTRSEDPTDIVSLEKNRYYRKKP